MLPFLEETAAWRDYDVNSIVSQNIGIPIVACARGNYAANWGNTTWQQSADLDGDGVDDPGVTYHTAPFARARSVTFGDATDGLDSTVFVAEVVSGSGSDGRGAWFLPISGGSHYMSRFTLNGFQDKYGRIPPVLVSCISSYRVWTVG